MRYADGPTVTVDVLVDATAAELWPLITDINLPARFSNEFQGADWDDDTHFHGRNRHPAGGDWVSACTVVERVENQVFAWVVSDPANPAASWRFELVPEGSGTRLRQSMRIGPGPSGLTPAIESMPDKEDRIVARRLDEHRFNMLATVTGIKDLAESR